MTTEHGTNPTLRTYLTIVRKRRWWIACAALLGLAVSLGFALAAPDQYSATAQLLVQSSGATRRSAPCRARSRPPSCRPMSSW